MIVLIEDDCAPDAFEYFCKDLLKKTGHTYSQFSKNNWAIDSWVVECNECGHVLLDTSLNCELPIYTHHYVTTGILRM